MSRYAIVDIETTGGNSNGGKITEISIFLYEGNQIVSEFTSLINPERSIPTFISNLTGITNEMVENAPTFPQVAKQIIEITENAMFVAHNVAFDYNFVREEFASLGYDYHRKTLCTVTASRRFIPGHSSYSLGNICADLGIPIEGRHRARGDAFATVKLFELCLKNGLSPLEYEEKPLTSKKREYFTLFDAKLFTELPAKCGIYYFYNQKNDLIYIGKSKNIKQRVPSHFVTSSTNKGGKIKNTTTAIDFTLTGSELIALLMESEEIKATRPPLNKAQRKLKSAAGLYLSFSEDIATLSVQPINNQDIPLATFDTVKDGKLWLDNFCASHLLCPSYCCDNTTKQACFNVGIKTCFGICCGQESTDSYNERVQKAIDTLGFTTPNAIILDMGRTNNELSFVIIEQNQFVGYGWIDRSEAKNTLDEIKEHLHSTKPNADAKKLINGYLAKNKVIRIIQF